MIASFVIGITRASRQWKMALLLAAANLLVAAPLAVPVFLLVGRTSGGTRAARTMFADKLDFVWLADVVNEQFAGYSAASTALEVGLLLLALGALYLPLSLFFAGGILSVLAAEGEREGERFTMRRFWEGGGAYFARFFRLACIALFFYAAAYAVYRLLMIPVDAADARASAVGPGLIKKWAVTALLAALVALVNVTVDYAKIRTVLGNRRRMSREFLAAARFVLRRFVRACGLYLLIAAVGLIAFLALAWLRSLIPQSSYLAVFAALLLGQLALAARMWTRVAFYAAEMDFYRRHARRAAPPREEAAPEREAEEVAPAPAAAATTVEALPDSRTPESQETPAASPVIYELRTDYEPAAQPDDKEPAAKGR
jgi:hypothetical protein